MAHVLFNHPKGSLDMRIVDELRYYSEIIKLKYLFYFIISFCIGEANKQVSEYKLKLQKSEQDLAAFHANVSATITLKFICNSTLPGNFPRMRKFPPLSLRYGYSIWKQLFFWCHNSMFAKKVTNENRLRVNANLSNHNLSNSGLKPCKPPSMNSPMKSKVGT